jgi:hypothetical protein
METFKTIVGIVTSFFFGFGLWFLVFWFITMEPNLFIWGMWTKVTYLILSFLASAGFSREVLED